jgi:hypothetical protein
MLIKKLAYFLVMNIKKCIFVVFKFDNRFIEKKLYTI